MAKAKTALLMTSLAAFFGLFGYYVGGLWGTTYGFLFSACLNGWVWWRGRDMILTAHRAYEIGAADEWNLIACVTAIAARAQVPCPRVYLIDCAQPNALAVGRSPQDAALVLSTGLCKRLTRAELAAVIGHELGHIRARDSLLMMVTSTFAGAVIALGALLGLIGWAIRRNGGWPFVAIGIAAPITALILKFAISREREFAADRFSALQCSHPRSLIKALEKIAAAVDKTENTSALYHPATANLFFVDPLPRVWWGRFFASHPSVHDRIGRLRALLAE